MTEAAPQTGAPGEEPSIEEILASIRKIISDEPPPEGQEANDAGAETDSVPDMPLPPVAEKPAEAAAMADAPAAQEDEILDLGAFAEETNMTAENTTESFTAPGHPAVEKDQAADGPNLDFDLGLEDSSNNEPTRDISEIMAASNFSSSDKAPVSAESLVSDTSASVATAAMAKLAAASDPTPTETQLWVGARTIEQVVEDLMRPMLKTWLDQNLPRLVERLVEKELARMARRATE